MNYAPVKLSRKYYLHSMLFTKLWEVWLCKSCDCLSLILRIELVMHDICIVIKFNWELKCSNQVCNTLLKTHLFDIVSFQLLSCRRSLYLVNVTSLINITDSLHNTHPPFHIIYLIGIFFPSGHVGHLGCISIGF